MGMSDCKKRKEYILENYGFECQCRECVLFQKRDVFRKKYNVLEQEMEKAFEIKTFDIDKILKCAQGMVEVIKVHFNGYPPLLSAAYMKFAEARLMRAEFGEVVKYM